mmetsp:Transcript_23752/g.78216  ORF Transcript_23752/g.78216 Transcript_23752/m.78216 type:complete len:389 (+) Transcript_23752:360-1526(+)
MPRDLRRGRHQRLPRPRVRDGDAPRAVERRRRAGDPRRRRVRVLDALGLLRRLGPGAADAIRDRDARLRGHGQVRRRRLQDGRGPRRGGGVRVRALLQPELRRRRRRDDPLRRGDRLRRRGGVCARALRDDHVAAVDDVRRARRGAGAAQDGLRRADAQGEAEPVGAGVVPAPGGPRRRRPKNHRRERRALPERPLLRRQERESHRAPADPRVPVRPGRDDHAAGHLVRGRRGPRRRQRLHLDRRVPLPGPVPRDHRPRLRRGLLRLHQRHPGELRSFRPTPPPRTWAPPRPPAACPPRGPFGSGRFCRRSSTRPPSWPPTPPRPRRAPCAPPRRPSSPSSRGRARRRRRRSPARSPPRSLPPRRRGARWTGSPRRGPRRRRGPPPPR